MLLNGNFGRLLAGIAESCYFVLWCGMEVWQMCTVNVLLACPGSCQSPDYLAAHPSPGDADISPVCELSPMIATRIGAIFELVRGCSVVVYG
jgi:hypothetical protein